MALGGKSPFAVEGREEEEIGGGQRTHKEKEAHAQRSRGGGRRKVNKTAADVHTSKKLNKQGQDRAAVEEDSQAEKVRVQASFSKKRSQLSMRIRRP